MTETTFNTRAPGSSPFGTHQTSGSVEDEGDEAAVGARHPGTRTPRFTPVNSSKKNKEKGFKKTLFLFRHRYTAKLTHGVPSSPEAVIPSTAALWAQLWSVLLPPGVRAPIRGFEESDERDHRNP